jgi:hypothetical protein
MKKSLSIAGLLAALLTIIPASAVYAGDNVVIIGADSPPAIVVTPANTCSASSPCGTYAVINSNNEVTNTIVCQAAVCGGGSFANTPVVLQVPTSPDNSGTAQGGYLGNGNGPVIYDPGTQTFSMSAGSFSIDDPTPVVVTNTDKSVSSTQLSSSVSSSTLSFKAPSSIGAPKSVVTKKASNNARGKLTAVQRVTDSSGINLSTVTQSQEFDPGVSVDGMMAIINNNLANYLISNNSTTLLNLLVSLGYK